MSKIEAPTSIQDLPLATVKSMIGLATSGFGVVVALAWNDLIQAVVHTYIDPYLGKNSGVVSLVIYAAFITIMAVVITMQLTGLQTSLEKVNQKLVAKKQLSAKKSKRTK